jgi:hypothetical protein
VLEKKNNKNSNEKPNKNSQSYTLKGIRESIQSIVVGLYIEVLHFVLRSVFGKTLRNV